MVINDIRDEKETSVIILSQLKRCKTCKRCNKTKYILTCFAGLGYYLFDEYNCCPYHEERKLYNLFGKKPDVQEEIMRDQIESHIEILDRREYMERIWRMYS